MRAGAVGAGAVALLLSGVTWVSAASRTARAPHASSVGRRQLLKGSLAFGPLLLGVPASHRLLRQAAPPNPLLRAASIYCQGPILDAVQRAGIFNDCKIFVDSPLREDLEPEDVLRRFAALGDPSNLKQLRAFVRDHFERPGADLVSWAPTDFQPSPPALGSLRDPQLREWALALNSFWSQLGRATASQVYEAPQRHSLLALPHPFIVPGGRFVETYYWDSYWIIKGLLTCGMRDTAKGMVLNLLHQVDSYGFVPNGGRVYYLNRSQPPMLETISFLPASTCSGKHYSLSF